ncbi:GntR family transcriptional regulator [Longispora sp. K20-0274]|uniref:GntR family transcriptional regulator n=1 Tax=Longispora sp. K20-0274 TaxID=3088255 RepID=UPI00399A4BCE
MSARFRDLAAEIRAAIADGTFPPGSKLPSESELAERYDVSRGTVRQTFALLRADGLIASHQGARRIVLGAPRVQSFTELRSFSLWARSLGEVPSGRKIALVRREASPGERAALGEDRIYHLTRVRLLSGQPVMIERTAYVERIGALVAGIDTDTESICERLEELGIVFAHAEHTLDAVPADDEDADLLGTVPGTPLLRERRRATDPDGRPLEWSEDRYLGGAVAVTVRNSVSASVLERQKS